MNKKLFTTKNIPSKDIVSINGIDHEISSVRNKEDKSYFDLKVKNVVTKETTVFSKIFWYTEGWSQGTNRSMHGYYLNIEGYGCLGNGHGQSTKTKPYLSPSILEFFQECLNGKHWDEKRNSLYLLNN